MITFNNVRIQLFEDQYPENVGHQLQVVDEAALYRDIFGVDLGMLGEGEILTVKTSSGGDVKLVGGLLNFTQAIHHRLTTVRGTLPEDPTIGIPWYNFLGKSVRNQTFVIANLSSLIEEELYRDHRTQNVSSIDIEFLDVNTVGVNIAVEPLGLPSISFGFTTISN